MRVITVSNFKGGVGKTTTAVNLATLCARHDKRTLLIDLDPQASATDYFGLYEQAEDGANVIGLLYEGMTVSEMAYDSGTDNLRVIPATLALINQNELLLPSSRCDSRWTTRQANTTSRSSTPPQRQAAGALRLRGHQRARRRHHPREA